ncbi:hypothetical protein FAF44_32985 [Nonomuraea sp. MG754425]|nr:hypothetical protein [Nonomuraea sp. MG754425]
MLAALHGELALHPWRDPFVASSDAYSLFVARSSAMRWLTETEENASGGVWGMNDAGQNSGVSWFQVSLTEPVPADRPLPVQAFLSCAGDVVARIGALRLRAVQVLLPVQSLDASARASSPARGLATLLQDNGWFADCDPRSRTRVRVRLESGQDSSVHSAAPEMLQWMQGFKQDVFSCDSFSLTDDDDMVLKPAVIAERRLGSAHHRATFHGTLAEWSLDALGWSAAFLAEASCRYGVRTPLMLTACQI